jgi:hypothetical protein
MVDPRGNSLLSQEDMQNISGGSLTDTVIKLVISGMDFFYRMGIREAKRMKTQL